MQHKIKIVVSILILFSTILTNACAIGLVKDENGNNYLIGEKHKPLYYFIKDAPNSGISNCYGSCSNNWIPLEEQVMPPLPSPLRIEDFSTILRADGVYQTTYKGQPLYTYIGDNSDTPPNGNGKDSFWFLMRP